MPALATARLVLAETRSEYPLGSSNIGRTSYDPHTDSYRVHRGLLRTSRRTRGLEALLDPEQLDRSQLLRRGRNELQDFIQRTGQAQAQGFLTGGDRRRLVRDLMARRSTRRGVGNCDEMATYAFLAVIRHNDPAVVQLELAYVAQPLGVDHVFVVLNRPGGSNIADTTTWGPGTIILDPWINEVFYAPNFVAVWQRANPFVAPPSTWQIGLQFDRNTYENTP
ncbi:MAG: hypothetical protein AAGC60_21545 [Acidobacteriota bacterium]